MSIYAIGDVQGCHDELRRLVDRLHFDPAQDRLWLAGDLVNRGPRSLEVLRFVKGLADRAVTVLGNHDLHLLGCAYGVRPPKSTDTLRPILEAPDRDELIAWLAAQPFLHRTDDYLLVHAGLHPTWTAAEAMAVAAELAEFVASGPAQAMDVLRSGSPPPLWRPELSGPDRLRAAAAILTRIRTCTSDGTLDLEFAGPPAQAPHGRRPWFEWPGAYAHEVTVVFGHWSALGLRVEPHVVALDTGCVWGGALTAVRLDDGAVFQQPRL